MGVKCCMRVVPACWLVVVLFGVLASASALSSDWRSPSNRATLRNKRVEAVVQAGQLMRLKDLLSGEVLLSVNPADIPSRLPLFGQTGIDLDSCTVKQTATPKAVRTTVTAQDGAVWSLEWRIETGNGDLILNSTVTAPKPIDEIRIVLLGASLDSRRLVWVDSNGVSRVVTGPSTGCIIGNPETDGSPQRFVHPLVALFQGRKSGWFIEGRDPRAGPSCVMFQGTGGQVNMGFDKRIPMPSKQAKMYEIRIRTYKGQWADAVDPYVQWLEDGAGFLPLDKLPKPIAWVNSITNQTYIPPGDFASLDRFAKVLDPRRTYLGRLGEFRNHTIDSCYPDYTVNDVARKWFGKAKEMGFHCGPWYNTFAVSMGFPELIERFRPGFMVTGKDASGNDTYDSIEVQPPLNRCSPAYKPWRDYLIAQMKDAINAGADTVHLDEVQTPCGAQLVDGVTAIEGVRLLMKEITARYPGVAVESEQVNPMTAKYAKIAITAQPLGHPLSGYIYRRFVKIVPDGSTFSPTDEKMMDAVQSYGFIWPGANPDNEKTWVQIAKAFQDYSLQPDIRLPRTEATTYENGVFPVYSPESLAAGQRLFGYRGKNGITAYFEKRKDRRGLVVYKPLVERSRNEQPQWIGTLACGVTQWSGPGYLKDWLIHSKGTMLALDPGTSYSFDENLSLPETGFHVFSVPADFALCRDPFLDYKGQPGQRNTSDGSFYSVKMAGHGELGVYVPDGYLAYLDGRPLAIDPTTRTSTVHISAAPEKPSTLIAFRKTDVNLAGQWIDLPWQIPANQREGYMVKRSDGSGFFNHVAGVGLIVGRFASAARIRLQGTWGMEAGVAYGTVGDGVIRINGQEVLRLQPGSGPPYPLRAFDVDVTQFAGQYVVMEFQTDGKVRGFGPADWFSPQIILENT